LLVSLIVLLATDNCQGPLRGAVLILTQVVTLLAVGVNWLYSISVIALISLAKDPQGTLAINSVELRG
jgi:hypothetical protein